MNENRLFNLLSYIADLEDLEIQDAVYSLTCKQHYQNFFV